MQGWTLLDIEKKKAAGKILDYKVMSKNCTKQQESCTKSKKNDTKRKKNDTKRKKVAGSVPKALQDIFSKLEEMGIPYVTEYRFHKVRKFRFDIAILEHKIAVEYEGIASDKSRHTSITGYTRDATKYNLATSEGWKVLRYTALNWKGAIADVETIINQMKK
jgi:hypothetical protein